MASTLIEADLYNGRIHIIHNPFAKGSQPRYKVDNTKPTGVTTILGQTLSKDLMQWAVDCCTNYLMEHVEDGITSDHIETAAQEYKRKRDTGAGTGTEAHALVEKFLKEEPITLVTTTKEARLAYGAFVKWFTTVQPVVINVEQVIYSEAFGYAGTYDCMLRVGDKVYLCDLKTTNASRSAPKGVYADHFLQLGAYWAAHEEQRQYELANGGTDLVEVDDLLVISAKKDGSLDLVSASDMGLTPAECGTRFCNVVDLFRFRKATTKKLGGR